MLPSDYATNTQRRYPVLYLLHGLTGDENDWWTRTRLAEYAARYHLIIVTPGVGDSWYANSASDPRARYEDVIIKDLIPFIDAHYRTVPTRDGRAIAGLSMGGLGAVKFALRYPQMFAFAGSFSGAFGVP
jgi:S-formylglutathione hydrolase FrmB